MKLLTIYLVFWWMFLKWLKKISNLQVYDWCSLCPFQKKYFFFNIIYVMYVIHAPVLGTFLTNANIIQYNFFSKNELRYFWKQFFGIIEIFIKQLVYKRMMCKIYAIPYVQWLIIILSFSDKASVINSSSFSTCFWRYN